VKNISITYLTDNFDSPRRWMVMIHEDGGSNSPIYFKTREEAVKFKEVNEKT